MTEPADQIARALQAYAAQHNLPAETTFALYSPNTKLTDAMLSAIRETGGVLLTLPGIHDDELWLTDARLDHATKTKIA